MTYYDRLKRKQLSDILVDEEMSSKEAVITAVHEAHQSGRTLSEILISGNELAEYDMVRVLVQHYQLPFLELTHHSYHRDLVDKFPPEFLRQKRLIPLDRFGTTVCFAIQEFPSDEVMDKLVEVAGGQVFFYAAMATDISEGLRENLEGRVEEQKLEFAPAAISAGAGDEPGPNQDWAELFDSANESIVSNLTSTPVKDDEDGAEDDPLGILGGLGDD
jgi:hypothetical protein